MASTSVTHWTTFYRNALYVASTGNFDSNGPLFFWSSVEVMRWIAPILLAAMMLSAFSGLAQGGYQLCPWGTGLEVRSIQSCQQAGSDLLPRRSQQSVEVAAAVRQPFFGSPSIQFAPTGKPWCMPPASD